MSNPQAEKLALENLAKLQQMRINARLTALQAAQTLMGTHGYLGVDGMKKNEAGIPEPTWIRPPGTVDIITLLAQAQMIEDYILGNIEKESVEAMEEAKKRLDPNRPKLVRP